MSLQNWLSQFPTQTHNAKTVIIPAGPTPKILHAIKSGLVKMHHTHQNGQEATLSFSTPGCILPLPEVFLKRPNHYEYITMIPTTTHLIPADELRNKIKSDPEFLHQLFERFLKGFMVLTEHITALKHNQAADKIDIALQQISGKSCSIKDNKLTKCLTQQEIANYAGVTRETLSRHLRKK